MRRKLGLAFLGGMLHTSECKDLLHMQCQLNVSVKSCCEHAPARLEAILVNIGSPDCAAAHASTQPEQQLISAVQCITAGKNHHSRSAPAAGMALLLSQLPGATTQ